MQLRARRSILDGVQPPPVVTVLRPLRVPLLLAVLLSVGYLAVYEAEPSGTGWNATPVLKWLAAASLTAWSVVGVQMIRFLILDVGFVRTQGHRAPALLHAVVAVGLYAVVGLTVAKVVFDAPLTGAIATSAVASVVLGLALQETLGNFFSGIALQVERPFRLGDVVATNGTFGRIEALNWRATSVRTADDSRVVIPNALIARETIEVFARREVTRRRLELPGPYEVPPQRIVAIVQRAVGGVPGVADRPQPVVRVASFDDSSVGYELLYWVEDYLRAPVIDAQVRERIWYAYARNDVAIPFPHEVQVPYEPPPEADDEDPVEERALWLGESDLLTPLSAEERRQLAAGARTVLYGPGESILRTGDEGGSMFVVRRGHVEIRVLREGGRRVRVAEMEAGDVIGEMSLLTGEPRSADARALDEVELIEVRRPEMKEILARNEALAEALAGEASARIERRADTLAQAEAPSDGQTSQASLLQRIRTFFEL